MSEELPERIEPLVLAEDGVTIEGVMPLQAMPRLRDMAAAGALVHARLRFGLGDDRRPAMIGEFSTTLAVVCQRCLQTLALPLRGDIKLALVHGLDEADRLDDRYDVLPVAGRPMSLAAILEDEVLLAVPAAPLHALADCPGTRTIEATDDVSDTEQDAPGAQRSNPFAVLAELKKDQDSGPH